MKIGQINKHFQSFEVAKTRNFIILFLDDIKFIFPTIVHCISDVQLVPILMLGNSLEIVRLI